MPPKKGQRKSMPGRIHKAPTLTPSRRSPRVPPLQNNSNETSRPAKTLNIPSASPQDNPMNIRFYSPKTAPSSPYTQSNPPETPSSRRRAFQSRPSRLSTVYTPTVETPATNQGTRRTRRTTTLTTPKQQPSETSDLEIPDSAESGGWTFDQYIGSFKTEPPADGPSSPTSASDMRNSSRVRKPTRRAIESLETSRRNTRRQTTLASSPTVETPNPGAKNTKHKVTKKPIKKTRASQRMANSNQRKDATSLDRDVDINVAAKLLVDLAVEALSPGFKLPPNHREILKKLREDFYKSRNQANYDAELPVDTSSKSDDADVADEDTSAGPEITLTSPAPLTTGTTEVGILSNQKISDIKVNTDGWVDTGRVNSQGEEITLIPDNYHPHFAANSYGYEGLPWPPVRARSTQQAEADYSHGFPPLMGSRNVPAEALNPFTTENVQEEQARALANAPASAPPVKDKKPRARKRRQTEPAPADTNGEEAVSATATVQTPAPNGGRKSQRRRRQTVPAPAAPSSSSPSTPPTTTTQAKSGRAGAVASPATESNKPKVQRLRLTLKPVKTASPGRVSVSAESLAVKSSPSPALSSAPSPVNSNKRRPRRG
ncbi:hypothetical protein N7452_004670 [Penicillium brevicompactum]|uniref:Uncharacterized protein n=1 Tax=Penicillium brevicompactum TaxID=5074 RepID=A0A9W9UEF1_PENBR|nr:hypothetical protein N7452_004670 [Penicillium brevicompactum]